jgi:uncharacterized protein
VTDERASGDLRYDRMVEDALRSVVRRALIHVAEHGLPGNHHFYITFRTDHPGSEIPQPLSERYPGEMTIVLQHQFWGLEVDENQFCVTLSFADVPHRLVVPFAAVTAFADPSVRFGLQFDVESAETPGDRTGESQGVFESGPVALLDEASERDNAEAADDKKEKGDKVVTLDAFRKK